MNFNGTSDSGSYQGNSSKGLKYELKFDSIKKPTKPVAGAADFRMLDDKSVIDQYKQSSVLNKIKNRPTVNQYNALNPLEKRLVRKPDEVVKKELVKDAGSFAGSAKYGLVNSASLGAYETLAKKENGLSNELMNTAKGNKFGYGTGTVLGYIAPTGGALKLTKPLVKLATKKVANKLGKRVIEGTIVGGALGAGEGLARGENTNDVLKRTATTAAIGGAGDLAIGLAGKALKPVAKSLINKFKPKTILPKATNANGIIGKAKTFKRYTGSNVKVKQIAELDNEISKLKKNLTEYEKAMTKATDTREGDVLYAIRQRGGIAPSRTGAYVAEYAESVPSTLKNKNGLPIDEIASEMNMDVNTLLNKVRNSATRSEEKRMLAKQARQYLDNDPDYRSMQEAITTLENVKKEISIPVTPIKSMGLNNSLKAKPKVARSLDYPLPRAVSVNTDDTIRSQINRTPKKKSFVAKVKEVMDNFQTQFVDDMSPLRKAELKIRGKIGDAKDSLYKKARLYKGVPEKANAVIETELKPIVGKIEKEGFDYKDLGDYALAVHARDVNKAGLVSGFDNQKISNTIARYNNPVMEEARKELIQYNDKLLKELVDAELITPDALKALKEKWPNYMPLFRSFDDETIEFAAGLQKSFSNVSAPIKRLKGSERDVIDPMESVIKNTFQSINAAERNKVGLELSKLAKDDVGETLIRRLADDELIGRKNVVTIKENGNPVNYEVDADIYKAMKDLNKEGQNFLIKALSVPASTLRAGATLTPEFALRNPMRDVVNAYVTSKSGFNPFMDFPVALADIITKGKALENKLINGKSLYSQWLKDSGGYGNVISMDRNMHKKALNAITKEDKRFINILNPKSFMNMLRTVSDVTESATKLGEYRAAIRSGASRAEAAYRSRDLMDFARGGASIREANKVVAFLNANIQGKSKLLRAIREDPKGTTVRITKAVVLPSVAAIVAQKYLSNDIQAETIKDSPDWLKDTFWLVPVPGTNQVARIPKPFDVAAAGNSVERFLDYAFNYNQDAFDGFIRNTIKQQSIPVMLSGVTPVIEGMTNYSFFRQAPIVPQREQNLNKEDQYDIYTSETAKGVAKTLRPIVGENGGLSNFGSPRIVDNTIKGVTAGLGGYALDAIDFVLEKTGAVGDKKAPSKNVSQLPVLKGFLVNPNSTGKSMEYLYDTKEKLTREKGSAKTRGEKFNNEVELKFLSKTTDQIGELNKEYRDITNSKLLSSDQKKLKLETLSRKRNEIARKAKELHKARYGGD